MRWGHWSSAAAAVAFLACSGSSESKAGSPCPQCPEADGDLQPFADEGFFALTMSGWERFPDIEKPVIMFAGLMTGRRGAGLDETLLHFSLGCRWPKRSDTMFNPYWDAPERWNCVTESYVWTSSGVSQFQQGYFGQPEGYRGGMYEPRERGGGKLIPQQPTLVDGGTGLLFPYVDIQGPGTLKVSCSKPLRDYRDARLKDSFKGCDVLWQNLYVAETFFRTTIGRKVEVPGFYVRKEVP